MPAHTDGAPPSLAVLLTGFLRHKAETFDALRRHVLDPYGASLFVATWDVSDSARAGVREDLLDPTIVTTHDVRAFYGDALADCRVRSYELFERDVPRIAARDRPFDVLSTNERAQEHHTYWMDRLFAQWYIVRDGLAMIAEHERLTGRRFDLICRTRSDIRFDGDLPSWPADRVLVANALPGSMPADRGWVPDYFTIGPSDEIRKLADLCFAIEPLYDRQNVDTTNAENLFAAFLVQRDVPVAVAEVPFTRL